MKKSELSQLLSENAYPGRGIAIGLTPNGRKLVVVYFIMGRSENSRNRIFVAEEAHLRTKAFDDTKLTDPSLIIYYPVRQFDRTLIVTNGDQTDTINDFIQTGKSFEDALQTREFEPDPPNYTPRISGIAQFENGTVSYKLSILKTLNNHPMTNLRFFYQYDIPEPGTGHFIHTYQSDGTPLPSFEGEPRGISIPDSIDAFTTDIWDALNKENKVSLFVRFVDIQDATEETKIMNVHALREGN
ncbi:MAG: IMP cyclohydrolase [Clostridia bacterium]